MSPKSEVTVSIEKSGYELMVHLSAIVKTLKDAGSFGVEDIPGDVAVLVAHLPGMVANIMAIPGEMKENQLSFIKGLNLGLYEMLDVVMK